MKYLILTTLLLSSCANVSTTRFEYIDPSGSKVIVEMPKEIEATDLKVSIDALNGLATITAKEWSSKNVATIAAQGKREGDATESAAKGVVEGIIDGVKGVP